jgi:5-methyltetrahydrofolate--homocysteine methyltransferase
MGLWKSRLEKKKILIADGGWGTEMQKRGLAPGEPPEAWNLSRPEDVLAVARSYAEAGADVILTNTFGGSPLKLAKVGLKGKVLEINRQGSSLSQNRPGPWPQGERMASWSRP